MIKGIGIDAVELPRIAEDHQRKTKFIDRVLTSNEIAQFRELPFHRQSRIFRWAICLQRSIFQSLGNRHWQSDLSRNRNLKNDAGQPVVTKSPYSGKVWVSITHTDGSRLCTNYFRRVERRKNMVVAWHRPTRAVIHTKAITENVKK